MLWPRSCKLQSRLLGHQKTWPHYRRQAICQKLALRYQSGEKKIITICGKACSCRGCKRPTSRCGDPLINHAQRDLVEKAATHSCLRLGERKLRMHRACKILRSLSSPLNRLLLEIPENSSDQLRRLHPHQLECLHPHLRLLRNRIIMTRMNQIMRPRSNQRLR
jgi:hypothetical protein